ncbi:GNAT family N-acetyltransferase [bacterium]|nr:MAG: GNAT family N-acetyltransferase [bacterium]
MSGSNLRLALPSDLEALVDLETRAMHFPMGHRVREWFRDDHPNVRIEHIAVVERDGKLVAAAALLPGSLLYRGIPFRSAHWDAVVTDDHERRQGHCRALFDFLTSRSKADCLLVEGLTWLYRRFGYYPAIQNHGGCNSGGRIGRVADFPPTALQTRPAAFEDIPLLQTLRQQATGRYVVGTPVSEAAWRHAIRHDRTVVGRGETGLNKWEEIRLLVRKDEPVGFYMHDPWDIALLMELEILPGATTWREAGATAVHATGEFGGQREVKAVLPESHPLFSVYPCSFGPPARAASDWTVRIPHLAGFLAKVASALERTLDASHMAGWTGDLTLSRIEDAVQISFKDGRITGVEPWRPERPEEARLRLTPGRFEALVFGYRSLDAILAEDADCSVADEEAEALVRALFPPGDSFVRMV